VKCSDSHCDTLIHLGSALCNRRTLSIINLKLSVSANKPIPDTDVCRVFDGQSRAEGGFCADRKLTDTPILYILNQRGMLIATQISSAKRQGVIRGDRRSEMVLPMRIIALIVRIPPYWVTN
jgi:hypothetical protein